MDLQSRDDSCTFPVENTNAYPFDFPIYSQTASQQIHRLPRPLTDSRHDPDEQHLRDVLRVVQSVQTRTTLQLENPSLLNFPSRA
jgi:hypothetical protein